MLLRKLSVIHNSQDPQDQLYQSIVIQNQESTQIVWTKLKHIIHTLLKVFVNTLNQNTSKMAARGLISEGVLLYMS